MNLIFIFAVAFSVAALTPLALPLLLMATKAVRLPSRDGDGLTAMPPGQGSQLEVELSVRARLYGEPRRSI
jgi:hypothetical protein